MSWRKRATHSILSHIIPYNPFQSMKHDLSKNPNLPIKLINETQSVTFRSRQLQSGPVRSRQLQAVLFATHHILLNCIRLHIRLLTSHYPVISNDIITAWWWSNSHQTAPWHYSVTLYNCHYYMTLWNKKSSEGNYFFKISGFIPPCCSIVTINLLHYLQTYKVHI